MKLLEPNISFSSELTINKMVNDLHELIAKLNRVNVDTTKIETIYNNLNVLSLFSQRHIISVAGLQSVGKTHLIKRVLGLPDDLLLSEVGVGEKRPVLISADRNFKKAQYYCTKSVRNISGGFDMVKTAVTKDELNTGVQDPSSDMLWFEIVLPDDKQLGHLTLALLPGFERSTQSDSQKFLDIFLNCSTGMILVLNHIRLAQQDQELLLQKVSSTYKDKTPGFVLTYANEMSEETKETILNNLKEKFSIEKTNQIVLSDIGIETVSADVERLIKQNSKFTYDSLNLHHKKLVLIGQDLFQEISKIENSIKAKYDTDDDTQQLRAIQKEFNKHREQYLKMMKKTLDAMMENHIRSCNRIVTDDLKNESSNMWERIKSAFKSDLTFNEKQEILEWITNIYTTAEPKKIDQMMIQSIESTTKTKANNYKSITFKPTGQVSQPQSLSFLQPKNKSESSLAVSRSNEAVNENNRDNHDFLNEEIEHTLQVVQQYLNPAVVDVSLSDNELRYMPIIAGAIAQQIILSKDVIEKYEISENEMSNYTLLKEKMGHIDPLKDEVNNLVLETKHMVAGAAVFFGIDAIDGELNSVGAIIGALQGLGLTAAAATGVAVGGVAALAAGIAIIKGSEKIEKYKFERQDYAKNILHAAGKYQVDSTMELMNDVMDGMEDKLVLAYKARRQSNVNLSVYEDIDTRIGRLKNECGKLREVAFRNAVFIK